MPTTSSMLRSRRDWASPATPLSRAAADAVIAIRGEFGTLSEVGFALKIGKPVVGLDTWELHRSGEVVDAIKPAATPAEAVDLALRLARATLKRASQTQKRASKD